MNMMALIYRGRAIVVDCGVLFPESNQIGLDLIIPKVEFLVENDIQVDALFLTHAHEDHIGAIPFLYHDLEAPILYGTEFTLAMIEQRLMERTRFTRDRFHPIYPKERVQIGVFEIEALNVTHSLVDTIGLAIQTPQGMILHSGDFKIDHHPLDDVHFDEARVRELGNQGVDLLLSDSTNVENEGWTESESSLGESLKSIIARISEGKIIVTLFSSNIHRIQTLLDAAKASGRKVAFCGRSVHTNVEISRRMGHLKFSDSLIIDSRRVEDFPPNQVLIISTGAQAESRSALMKMSLHLHPDVSILEGDTVIFSSRHIPGNEKKISSLANNIYRCGAKVIDYRDEFVHVSGHARREELRSLIEWSRPRHFLPVHGEYRMLVKHLELAQKVLPGIKGLVAENGQLVEFRREEGLRLRGRFPWGKIYLDEFRNLVPEELVRERKRLAVRGLVCLNWILSGKKLKSLHGPEMGLFGLPEENLDLSELERELHALLAHNRKKKTFELEHLEEEASLLIRRFFRKSLGIKPTVYPVISII